MHLMAVDRNWICPDDHRSGTNAIQPGLRPANGSAMKTMALPCSSPSSCLLAQVLVQVQSVHWDDTEAGTAAGTPPVATWLAPRDDCCRYRSGRRDDCCRYRSGRIDRPIIWRVARAKLFSQYGRQSCLDTVICLHGHLGPFMYGLRPAGVSTPAYGLMPAANPRATAGSL